MHRVNQAVSVLPGGVPSPSRRQPPILAAYEHFRLDRQGMLVSPRTLEYYDGMVLPFLRWTEADGVQRLEAYGRVSSTRLPRAAGDEARAAWPALAAEDHPGVAPGDSLLSALGEARGLPRRRPHPRAHSATGAGQRTDGLPHRSGAQGACCLQPAVPTEDLVVRILVGSGLRRAEICGLAVLGPDGLSDVMTDSLGRGRVELRVRGDAGAKGRKSRRVPITPKLAAAIKRYEARHRPETELSTAAINGQYATVRAAFRVHAHAFRAYIRDGRGKARLELRASPCGDGPLGLWNAAALRQDGYRA